MICKPLFRNILNIVIIYIFIFIYTYTLQQMCFLNSTSTVDHLVGFTKIIRIEVPSLVTSAVKCRKPKGGQKGSITQYNTEQKC